MTISSPEPRAVARAQAQAGHAASGTAAPDGAHPTIADPREFFRLPALMRRLTGLPAGRLYPVLGRAAIWVPLAITLLAAVLRFWNLAHPDKLIFDETYYVKDGWSLLHSGYEREWPKDINDAFVHGAATPSERGEYVVHPPLGKWLIAASMALFGTDTGLGWRGANAFMGTLAVLFLTLAAQRLFRSVALGAIAGVFMATDGQQLVLSRTGILDIFLTAFVCLSLWLVLMDRDSGRRRLARAAAKAAEASGGVPAPSWLERGPWLAWRPWRLALGVSLGALCAVKWSGLSFVAVIGLLVVWWDCQARRSVGIRRWLSSGVLRDGLPAFFTIIPTALLTYLATWWGWFTHPQAWGHGRTDNVTGALALIPQPLRDLWNYHATAYAFHQQLTSEHGWASNPWTWPFAGRPVLMLFDTSKDGVTCPGNPAGDCVQVITDLPNPILWWMGTAAILVVLWAFLARRDWRALAILSGVLAGYVPWLFYPQRTMFFFYTAGYQPFAILAVVYVLAMVAGRSTDSDQRRRTGTWIVGALVVLVLAASWFFWPVVSGETIDRGFYVLRNWLPSWI